MWLLGSVNIHSSLVYSIAIGGKTIWTENYCERTSRNASKIFFQTIGRSPGGLTTKIDSAVDALGNPLRSILTVGHDSDII